MSLARPVIRVLSKKNHACVCTRCQLKRLIDIGLVRVDGVLRSFDVDKFCKVAKIRLMFLFFNNISPVPKHEMSVGDDALLLLVITVNRSFV